MQTASRARRRRPLLGRLLALFLALLPVHGAAATVAAAASSPFSHACTDHVCSCLKKCPPKKAAKATHGCHGGSDAPANPLFQSAGCHHQEEMTGPVATRPHLIPSPTDVAPDFRSADVAGVSAAPPLAGFLTRDRRPPKTHA
jgi:hypothetical protein